MVILGLTGSIGMGKTTAATMLRRLGVPIHDADATVHRLLGPGGAAVPAVRAAFGEAVIAAGAVDRRRLGARVFNDEPALRCLESILHPLVRREERRFLAAAARRRVHTVALDVPLLFETGGHARVDATVVVSAPAMIQRARVLARPGMTPERLRAVLSRQMPDADKRRLADFVIRTGLGKNHALRALVRVVTVARALRGRRWPPQGTGPCGKSSSIPRPPASSPKTGTG